MERIQDRHQENQALTHYDDLGLPAGASDEEIREAYLNLVRKLHPDLLPEPSLKRFAENQMKRVSRAYAVLSDPDRRESYDAALAQGAADPDAPVATKRSRGRWRARALITMGWLICALAGTVGIGWYVSQQTGAPDTVQVNAAPTAPGASARVAAASEVSTPPGSAAAADAGDKATELDSLRADLAAAKAERDRSLDQNVLQAKELDFLTSRILAPPQRLPAGSGRFSGVWVLPQAKTAPAASAFTPDAVDLILGEHNGTVEGRYRARYPSMGGTEPPMIRFYFEGKCQEDVANAVWSGDGGAKGEIQLKLTSDNTLQLVWSVTDAGNRAGQASGTVALVRRREF